MHRISHGQASLCVLDFHLALSPSTILERFHFLRQRWVAQLRGQALRKIRPRHAKRCQENANGDCKHTGKLFLARSEGTEDPEVSLHSKGNTGYTGAVQVSREKRWPNTRKPSKTVAMILQERILAQGRAACSSTGWLHRTINHPGEPFCWGQVELITTFTFTWLVVPWHKPERLPQPNQSYHI